MVATDKVFAGSIPQIYDRILWFHSSSNPTRSIWPGDWPKLGRKMCWRWPWVLES